MQKSFSRDLSELEGVFRFLRECMKEYDIEKLNDFALKFIVEEIFTNMVKYSNPAGSDISIEIRREGERCFLALEEQNVEKFDPTGLPDPDVTMPIEERTPGGLGVFLVRKMAEHVDYRYSDRKATITITMPLQHNHV